MNAHANTVDEFCRSHRISRGTFYNELKAGRGPRIMKVGSRTLVSEEAAAEWRRRMESATNQMASMLAAVRPLSDEGGVNQFDGDDVGRTLAGVQTSRQPAPETGRQRTLGTATM
jgi:hypothetical protein